MNQQTHDYEARLTAVRRRLSDWEVDGLLIGSDSNRRWLSGFTGSAGWLLVTADAAVLATDFRYWEQALGQSPHFELYRLERTAESFQGFVDRVSAGRVGLEADYVTLAQKESLDKVEGVAWVALGRTLEPLRQIKSPAEIEIMRAAAAITDSVMAQINHLARPGMTERQLAWSLERRLRESGADAVAFPVIVASGPNAALAHHHPGERVLQPGDAIIVDMGASLDGYQSDLTRTFHLGDEPSDDFWRIYNLVLAAQTAALDGIHPGQTGQEADALARDVIAEADHGDHFGHGLGHGVGLDVHEAPTVSRLAEKSRLRPGMTTTVEPGVYLPGWGGVRIEDLVLLTEDGVERLSHCPKNPIIGIDD